MRILSGFLFFFGIVLLYFGLGMFAFPFEDNRVSTALLYGSLVVTAELLLCASGWLWFRAKRSDLSTFEPEKATAQSRSEVRRSLARHLIASSSAGFLLVMSFIVWILNR